MCHMNVLYSNMLCILLPFLFIASTATVSKPTTATTDRSAIANERTLCSSHTPTIEWRATQRYWIQSSINYWVYVEYCRNTNGVSNSTRYNNQRDDNKRIRQKPETPKCSIDLFRRDSTPPPSDKLLIEKCFFFLSRIVMINKFIYLNLNWDAKTTTTLTTHSTTINWILKTKQQQNNRNKQKIG